MCKMTGWSIAYYADKTTIEPHCCRDPLCQGSNYSFEDACDEVAEYYEMVAKAWRDRTHPDAEAYKDNE